jgi:site-specific DNA-methyltransferase (adenine-specific)
MIEKYLNKVYNIDIMDLLRQLPNRSVSCIYSDIDYGVGIRYGNTKYTKHFNEYISDYIALASESLRVLRDDGSAFFINYPKNNAFLWVNFLENACYDVQEYIWIYNSNIGHSPRRFTTAHRSILHCTKSKDSKFRKDNVAEPYVNPTDKRVRKLMREGSKGRSPYSWFYADMVKNVSKWNKNVNHPCVIPDKVSSMLVKSVTDPGDTVLILFAGSGSEIDVCRKLGRNWISAELNDEYCERIDRKLDLEVLTFMGGIDNGKSDRV